MPGSAGRIAQGRHVTDACPSERQERRFSGRVLADATHQLDRAACGGRGRRDGHGQTTGSGRLIVAAGHEQR